MHERSTARLKVTWLALVAGTMSFAFACATGTHSPGVGGGASTGMATGTGGGCAKDCSAQPVAVCKKSVCDPSTGTCQVADADDGSMCDDGLYCTVNDRCEKGACVGDARDCGPAVAACDALVCDEATQTCTTGKKLDGQYCVSTDLCMTAATCQAGACVGVPVDCENLPLPNDCSQAECNSSSGLCEVAPAFEGMTCAGDQCHDSTCSAGACVAADAKPDGTQCYDPANLCIKASCTGGACVDGAPVDCVATLAEFNPFQRCFPAGCSKFAECNFQIVPAGADCGCGVCNGNAVCVIDPAREGKPCDDGSKCTTGTTCDHGTCTGGTSIAKIFFSDDFHDNSAGWTLDPEWQIGPAMVSTGNDPSCGGPDPGFDTTPTADNGIAGAVIGGNVPVVKDGPHYLTSPVINTAGQPSVHLQYQRWLNADMGPSIMASTVEVFDGTMWVIVWQGSGLFTPLDTYWTRASHDISSYANANMQVRFGFNVGVKWAKVCSGWNIDDVVIQDRACL
jgi:hypothetical protein